MSSDLVPSTSTLSNHYEPQESTQSLLSGRGSGLSSFFSYSFMYRWTLIFCQSCSGTENLVCMYSSSRYLQMDDSGVYLTSLAVTVLISAIAIIGILLFTLVITLAILLASCQSKPDVVVKQGTRPEMGVDVCRSFVLNFELNNIQGNNVFPSMCEEYVFQYMTSGQYENDVNGAIKAADSCLISAVVNGDGLDTVIMDVDETALSNFPYFSTFQRRSMMHNVSAWNHWVEEAKSPPLIPTLKLYHKLQNHGLALIFLSGRQENQRNSTVKNLLHAGYSGWTMLIMRTKDEMQMNVQAYKSKQRLQLESMGLRIKGVIGDQWSDIRGPAVGNYTFKLPNPLYNIL
ncbi:acid phosphatase 1 isoform X1 [Cryptomeria japonica]|uniref:acid phosphatase 1 isoform X1 n=1 Tax=Cryptomeria japonica TaxID=3369 RepID=UPI0025AC8BA5|nr:acid phosphatase 1 isoform X1 [Cryptomeria japonica]XP_057851091.1 acid phosphatase 1 isoform X1 [Cryptomeria japonica]XP_057851092.1 acid phosphatase 1 isoform X1 [Cryptomeria japonica]XP_057851093.1 acid phosphatase 1 isoform X1 [Cryptomeria japonica]XP_057851094.1 acid phosphatase 1 isoform X1 [Cryptomeria japonica]XP_057851095.1 acid phosphatase 1 isoform X1 [Cryptomeria japonica]XP_057851096.1 acid phosphatase 1 isoform X1 [Cryptomeria japonica]XP_057851097.1 acid phosphatase 1 isofo